MPLSWTEILVRLLAAILLGGAVGYERGLRGQPAGLRTHLLVALGSAVFTMVSLEIAFFQHFEAAGGAPGWQFLRLDAGRLASNIVVGIGFLGGGSIVHAGMSIKGLTTAASLWTCAALGMAAGGGMFFLAAVATGLALFALVVLRVLVESPRTRGVRLRVRIDLEGHSLSRADLVEFLRPVCRDVLPAGYTRDLTDDRSRMTFDVRLPDGSQEEAMMKRLEQLPGLRRLRTVRSP